MKLAAAVLGSILFGWALVASAEARHRAAGTATVEYRVVTVEVQPPVDPAFEVETPTSDALVDWRELDRQTDCLWTLLQREQVAITFEIVMAAGVWTDALGGACHVIGEDDE